MDDERVWLKHPEHGGYFHCPAGAVEAWTSPELGWEVADDEPEEPNPVIAELLAARAALAAEEAVVAEQAAPKKRAAKATANNTEEG